MPIVAQGGEVTLRGSVAYQSGYPADAPDLELTVVDSLGADLAGFPVAIPPIVRESLGSYYYVWAVPADLAVGSYTATWSATVDGAPAGGSETVEVVAPGSITASGAYATVADFCATFDTPPPVSKYTRIEEVLVESASILDGEIGFDFHLHGPEARIYDAPRTRRRLCVHEGIIALTKVEIRYTPADSWVTVTSTDYWLEPRTPLEGESYTHVQLTGYGSIMAWPATVASIRLTGTFGATTPPTRIARANVALARQIYRADATVPGSIIGPNEFSGGAYPDSGRLPDEAWRTVKYYRNRDKCWI